MRTPKHIQASKYFAFLGDVQRLALKGHTWDTIPIAKLMRQHHIGGWRADLLKDFDLTHAPTMERACALMTMVYEYGKQMKSTRDERGAHRKPHEPFELDPDFEAAMREAGAPAMPEMQAMKDLVDDLPEVIHVQDTGTLPLMSDREMIDHLTRAGYIVCKPVRPFDNSTFNRAAL